MSDEAKSCECGHDDYLHLDTPNRQRTHGGLGKTTWPRFCRGHKGYDTLRGETPCRCKGFKEKADGLLPEV